MFSMCLLAVTSSQSILVIIMYNRHLFFPVRWIACQMLRKLLQELKKNIQVLMAGDEMNYYFLRFCNSLTFTWCENGS